MSTRERMASRSSVGKNWRLILCLGNLRRTKNLQALQSVVIMDENQLCSDGKRLLPSAVKCAPYAPRVWLARLNAVGRSRPHIFRSLNSVRMKPFRLLGFQHGVIVYSYVGL
jgi:hypothetical protein